MSFLHSTVCNRDTHLSLIASQAKGSCCGQARGKMREKRREGMKDLPDLPPQAESRGADVLKEFLPCRIRAS